MRYDFGKLSLVTFFGIKESNALSNAFNDAENGMCVITVLHLMIRENALIKTSRYEVDDMS